jgi:hypothetical protein
MAPRLYATIGRAADNDVVLDDPTVSNHHARLSWSGAALVIEDLSSANGTFVDGQAVKSVRARPGVELRCGQVAVPWGHPGLRNLLKAGAGSRTLVMPNANSPSYVCGACGHLGALPSGPMPRTLTCGQCNATLRTGEKPRGSSGGLTQWIAIPALAAASVFMVYVLWLRGASLPITIPTSATQVEETLRTFEAGNHVSAETAQNIAKALTPLDALTRNTAVKIAARTEGPFHVEQVAEIWNSVRGAWRYVNDPEGHEYFATATETIQNGYVGDCDDFATTLASMVIAIGGKARVVFMDGPGGGHAYAEACVQGEPPKVAAALTKHYRTRWSRYLSGRPVPRTIAYRTSAECPIWLNLDWNSVVPGGAYQPEQWAVAIYEDGHSEPLSAANPPANSANAAPTGKATAAPP